MTASMSSSGVAFAVPEDASLVPFVRGRIVEGGLRELEHGRGGVGPDDRLPGVEQREEGRQGRAHLGTKSAVSRSTTILYRRPRSGKFRSTSWRIREGKSGRNTGRRPPSPSRSPV